jgi:membrane protease subunit (stomatin/prohibitin family)
MAAYQKGQAFNTLRWGTGMPVTVLVGGQVSEVRARGTYAMVVSDPAKLAEQVPNPDDLPAQVRMLAVLAVNETLGERSGQGLDAAHFTAITPELNQVFQARLAPRLSEVGLQLTQANVEAIEIL